MVDRFQTEDLNNVQKMTVRRHYEGGKALDAADIAQSRCMRSKLVAIINHFLMQPFENSNRSQSISTRANLRGERSLTNY